MPGSKACGSEHLDTHRLAPRAWSLCLGGLELQGMGWLLTPWPGSDRRAEEEGRPVGPAGGGQCPGPPPFGMPPPEGGDLGRAVLAGATPWCGGQGSAAGKAARPWAGSRGSVGRNTARSPTRGHRRSAAAVPLEPKPSGQAKVGLLPPALVPSEQMPEPQRVLGEAARDLLLCLPVSSPSSPLCAAPLVNLFLPPLCLLLPS